MKKSFFVLLVFICTFTSCSFINSVTNSSYLTFSIDKETASTIKAYRDAVEESEAVEQSTDNIFIDISVYGDYEAKRTVPCQADSTITFSELTAGFKVYSEGLVYSLEKLEDGTEKRIELYSGKSEPMILKAGSNQMELTLKKISNEAEPQEVAFTVEYYLQNIDDDQYSLDKSEALKGIAGKETEVSASVLEGFTAKEITQQEIKADGSTVVKVYYDRNIHKLYYVEPVEVTLDSSDEEAEPVILLEESYRYGAEVKLNFDIIVEIEGHENSSFIGWYTEDEVIHTQEEENTLTMGDEDIFLIALWTEAEEPEEPEEPKESASISFTIVQEEASDISVEVTVDDTEFTGSGTISGEATSVIIFTAADSCTSYTWKFNGEVVDTTITDVVAEDNVLKVMMSGLSTGVIYDISLLADDYSYSAQIKKN